MWPPIYGISAQPWKRFARSACLTGSTHKGTKSGDYIFPHDNKLQLHLAGIVYICGPLPKVLLDKANQDIVRVIFDDQGNVKNVQLSMDKPISSLEKYTPGLEQDGSEGFVFYPADFHEDRPCRVAHCLKIFFQAVGFILATKMFLDKGLLVYNYDVSSPGCRSYYRILKILERVGSR